MAKVLCIESSTDICSVALVEDGKVLDLKEDQDGLNHSKLLTVYIQEILEANHLTAGELDAVAVSEGPGSYTGLRIGVSAAKGLCYGAGIPLIAISPLDAMVSKVAGMTDQFNISESDILVPMIDARRMEVYSAKYDRHGERITEITPLIVDENSFIDILEGFRILFFGNGSAKCKSVLQHKHAVFIDDVVTSAANMAMLATEKFASKDFVDVAYFEPFYLKSFIAIKSTKNILGI